MKRMIVDVSSILWVGLFSGEDKEYGRKVQHEGRQVQVNGWLFGYEQAMGYLVSMMEMIGCTPSDVILVTDGALSKAQRLAVYPEYKGGKDSRIKEQYDEFNKAKVELIKALREVGAQWAWQDGVEADDIISYLARELSGEVFILTEDGDMAALISDRVTLLRKGTRITDNPYGPFPAKHINVFKALVGDASDNIKGAKGFGEKAWLDFLVWGENDSIIAAIEGLIQRRELHELEDDAATFKPFRKVIDNADMVYKSYFCACTHPEWVNTDRQPLRMEPAIDGAKQFDRRLAKYAGTAKAPTWFQEINPKKEVVKKNHAIYDVELIGKDNPVFLFCSEIVETGERAVFWSFKLENDGQPDPQMDRLAEFLKRDDLTFVGFNTTHFDNPIIGGAIAGLGNLKLKVMADVLINQDGKHWNMPEQFGFDPVEFDHIDLFEVCPGVKISLKTYAGRIGYATMQDLPFEHDHDLEDHELEIVEKYCFNDVGVTKALFHTQKAELQLRAEMSLEYGIDLRSKSDAQVAEAVLKKVANITSKPDWDDMPAFVEYKVPAFIETESDEIQDLIAKIKKTQFVLNRASGAAVAPDYMAEDMQLCSGTYKVGLGGLHSTHDVRLYRAADEEMEISDIDVASYYPQIMIMLGLVPKLSGGAGARFMDAYKGIFAKRIEAKRAGNKQIANMLKICLNGTFGKLGSPYSSFYSPDLLLAVTLTGQLNLLTLIYDLEFRPDVKVLSANTDGITVMYPRKVRDRILGIIHSNAQRTGFEYEETRYAKLAMKDVNNYMAVTAEGDAAIINKDGIKLFPGKGGKVKRKGLYASTDPKENPLYLMKNQTMQVCSNMVAEYLLSGVIPEESIEDFTDIRDYVEIRNVKGGGIQYEKMVEVDDWIMVQDCAVADDWVEQDGAWFSALAGKTKKSKSRPGPVEIGDRLWRRPGWPDDKKSVSRKSRPNPAIDGVGGVPFGRVARWYMSTKELPPISYVKSGNKVAGTAGGRICMTLPDTLPEDLDHEWYIKEAYNILGDMGVIEKKREENADETAEPD